MGALKTPVHPSKDNSLTLPGAGCTSATHPHPAASPGDGDNLSSVPAVLPRSRCCRGGGATCLMLGQPPCLQPLSPPTPDVAGGVLQGSP